MRSFSAILTMAFVFFSSACQANDPFEKFWSEFHKNLMAEDFDSMKPQIKFPLQLLGQSDHTPAVYLGEGEFHIYIKKVLNERIPKYRDGESEPYRLKAYLEFYELVDENSGLPDSNRCVENFCFLNIDGKWLLTTLYHNEYEEE